MDSVTVQFNYMPCNAWHASTIYWESVSSLEAFLLFTLKFYLLTNSCLTCNHHDSMRFEL